MSISLTINGVEVNGANGVRLHGQVDDTRSASGIREVVIAGFVVGSNSADLNTKWAAVRAAVQAISPRIVIKPDSATANALIDMFPGDGTTIQVTSFASADPSRRATAVKYPFVVHIIATETQVTPTGSGTPTNFEGQVGDYKITTSFSGARIESRSLMISFGAIFDEDAFGPFTLVTVSDNGSGFARFNFSAIGAGVKGQTLDITGSTNYNGPHTITDINTTSNFVDTNTVFSSTDTGTGNIGNTIEPDVSYDAARSTLLTALLGTENDGSRDVTTGLVLSGESFGREAKLLTAFLSSTWVEREYNSNIRDYQMASTVADIVDWPDDPAAGAVPQYVSTVITFVVDKDAAGSDNPFPIWAAIRPAVIARIAAEVGETLFGPIDENVAFDENAGTVVVTLGHVARNATVFSFARTINIHERFEYMAWQDPDGFSVIQTAADPIDEIITISVTRSGVGTIDIGALIEAPTDSGFTFIEITGDLGLEQPTIKRGIGTINTQTAVKVFRRFRLKTGITNPRARSPITGRF